MLENQLDRLNDGIERLCNLLEAAKGLPTIPAKEAKAVETAAPAAEPKRARGRPAKLTAEEKATATPAQIVEPKKAAPPVVDEDDDFLSGETTPVKTYTSEDVKTALLAYGKRMAKPGEDANKIARALLAEHGGGATILRASATVAAGDKRILDPELYAAVMEAAL